MWRKFEPVWTILCLCMLISASRIWRAIDLICWCENGCFWVRWYLWRSKSRCSKTPARDSIPSLSVRTTWSTTCRMPLASLSGPLRIVISVSSWRIAFLCSLSSARNGDLIMTGLPSLKVHQPTCCLTVESWTWAVYLPEQPSQTWSWWLLARSKTRYRCREIAVKTCAGWTCRTKWEPILQPGLSASYDVFWNQEVVRGVTCEGHGGYARLEAHAFKRLFNCRYPTLGIIWLVDLWFYVLVIVEVMVRWCEKCILLHVLRVNNVDEFQIECNHMQNATNRQNSFSHSHGPASWSSLRQHATISCCCFTTIWKEG